MVEDQNILTDRLRLRQNAQGNTGNIEDSEPVEQHIDLISSLAGIENISERITKLEHSIVELTNTINGVMNELMDQKSILNQMKNNIRSDNQGNVDLDCVQKSGHLLRPHRQHNINSRSADSDNIDTDVNLNLNLNENSAGNSRMHIRHNPDADVSHASTNATSDYIIADIDKSSRETDDIPFKGEYIIANDSPAESKQKHDRNIRYNEAEDVVVYEKGDK